MRGADLKMRKAITIVISLLAVLVVSGCNNELSGSHPPNVSIKIASKKYGTKLGTYCWSGKCVDTVGPVELLKDEEPIQVQAGEQIILNMDYSPKPNEVHLSEIKNDEEKEIKVQHNHFYAPSETGTYYYVYSVWWMDEEKDNVSLGDAFYAFALKVQ